MSRLFLREIAEAAAELAGVELSGVLGQDYARPTRRARHRAAWAMRRVRPDASRQQIARALGRTDHTMAIYADHATERLRTMETDEATACAELLTLLATMQETRRLDALRAARLGAYAQQQSTQIAGDAHV